MTTAGIEIRPAVEEDLEGLVDALGDHDPGRHRDRLELQAAGRVLYLVALDTGDPVGHVLVRWDGASDEPVRRALDVGSCPDVEDLRVPATRRREGIGSALMAAAETRVSERGFPRIGLGVGTWNEAAAALYEKLGYRPAGVPPYEIGDSGVGADGEPWSWRETVVYLVKALRPD